MAGTINIGFNAQATAANGSNTSEIIAHQGQASIAMTGFVMFKETFTVPTSAAAISLLSVSGAPCFLIIVNRDITNYMEVGGDSGLTVFKIQINPGCFAVLPLPNAGTIYWKAHTATVDATISAYSA